jgi:hypothetical protein
MWMHTLAVVEATIAVPDGYFGLLGALFLVDLPVDAEIVLEQQERAHQLQSPNQTLQRLGLGRRAEHVFVQ